MVWKSSIGKNTLGNKMKELSELAQLSKTYTDHCLRATTIILLDRNGFEARHIMSISGHKSEGSIRSYSKTDGTKMQAMSKVLSNIITTNTGSNMCIARRNCYTLLKVSQWLWDEELQWKQLFLCLDFQISS